VLDLPFLPIDDLNVQADVHQAFHTEYEPWRQEMANWNAIAQFSSLLPQYEFMGRGTPPRKLEDWRGMRVRALGGLGDAMRKLDAVPTTVPAPEVYTAVERGVIQAAAFPYSYTFGAYRLHEIGEWFTSNIAIGAVHCPNVIHGPTQAALPAEFRQMLDDAIAPAYEALLVAYTEADARWIPIYQERMEEIRFNDDELAAFREAAGQPVWDDWVAQMEAEGLPGREALDFVLERAKRTAGAS
jgi:TRAP-type C4-dicarboxylate transport system substrate-binding protein